MEVPYLFVSILMILASYPLTSLFRPKISNLPPTIFPSLPIIGHLYLLKTPLYRTFAKISAKYGPIFLLQLGSRRIVVVSSPSAVEECFTKNDVILANRPRMLFGKIIGVNYTTLVWAPYGDIWRNLRRIATIEILSTHRLNEFLHIRADERKSLIHKLLSGSSPVNMKLVFYKLTLNVMMRMISGKRYFDDDTPYLEEEGRRFREMLHETTLLAEASNFDDYLPILSWLGVKGMEKRLRALQVKRDDFFQGLIEELRKSKGNEAGSKRKTMIEVLSSLQESEPDYYTDAMIRNFVLALLTAGSDTSAGTMEWALSLLLNHPQVLQKAQLEIDQVVGNDRLVDESDITSLPYLRCIINETLRLKHVIPLLIPHEASEDCVIGGYNIPHGTMLIINQWAIHHDPKVWADPEKFIPERFEGLEGTRDGFKLLPFGYGRRSCPGEPLAVRVIGMTLGSILQCFDWEKIGEDMVDMSEGSGIILNKALSLVAKCKPRQEMQNLLLQCESIL